MNVILLSIWMQVFFFFTFSTTFLFLKDLTTLFNWNVKQLFLFLKVTFNEGTSRVYFYIFFFFKGFFFFFLQQYSENIVWDSIIPIELKGKRFLKLRNERLKYPLRDVYNKLRGQTVKISLDAEIMPIVGYYYKVKYYFLWDYANKTHIQDTIAEFNYTMPVDYKY